MFKRLLLMLCLVLLPGSAMAAESTDWQQRLEELRNQPVQDQAARLKQLQDLYWQWQLDVYPEMATYTGEPGDHGRWTDNSEQSVAERELFLAKLPDLARQVKREQLSSEGQLDYDLLRRDLELAVAGLSFPKKYLVLSQLDGLHLDSARIFILMPKRSVADYEFIVRRLEGIPARIDQDLNWLRLGLEKGITPPRITLRDVPSQVRDLVTEDPFASPLLAAFAERPMDISESDWAALRSRAELAYRNGIVPALTRLADFLSSEYLLKAREEIGIASLPNGADWYRHLIRQETTLDMSPDEIHEVGLREVDRIRSEMQRVIEATGFEGDFAAFLDFLRTDPRFFHKTAEELLREYRDIAKRADAEMPKLFRTLPRNSYGIIPVPDNGAKSQPTAYYFPGSLKAGRAGLFMANTYALDTRPRWEMEALTLHEAVPGHHHQISLAQELDELHPLRRHTMHTAFVEGWGLYAESLGPEMGFYKDPYSKFGQLVYEMWRAVRLVVDTGIHAKGWSREQAIKFFQENTGKSHHDIEVEVDRYMIWPGQALAYKMGELKLQNLRKFAREKLGERFDTRQYHDHVLNAGSLPLNILDTRIRQWAEDVASGKSETEGPAEPNMLVPRRPGGRETAHPLETLDIPPEAALPPE
jgi:uncharacterized protein (DUF885 family)